MKHHDSDPHYLICKKISQLVKLINHLEYQNAEINFLIMKENETFDDDFEKILNNCQIEFQNVNKLLSELGDEYSNKFKRRFDDDFKNDLYQLEEAQVEANSDLKEMEISLQHNFAKLNVILQSINSDLNIQIKDFNEEVDNKKNDFENQILKIANNHSKSLKLIDQECEEKLQSLQRKTSLKMDQLDIDFNKSINELKAAFQRSELIDGINYRRDIGLKSLKKDISRFKENFASTKDIFHSVFSSLKDSLKLQTEEKNKLLNEISDIQKRQESETNEITKEINNSSFEYENCINKMKKEEKSRKAEMEIEGQDLLNSLKQIKDDNENEILSHELYLRISNQREAKEHDANLDDFLLAIDSEKHSYDRDMKYYNEKISQLEAELKDILDEISFFYNELTQITDAHSQERYILQKSQELAINDLKELQNIKIKDLTIKNKKIMETQENYVLIDKNKIIYNELLVEKKKLECHIILEEDSDILRMQDEYQNEINIIKNEYEKEIDALLTERSELIKSCLENQRKNIFEKNNLYANRYDEALENIRKSYNNAPDLHLDIEASYQQKITSLNKILESLNDSNETKNISNSYITIENIDSLNEARISNINRIESERKLLIEDYLMQQAAEENRHSCSLKEINYIKKRNELDEVRRSFNDRIQSYSLKIANLTSMLDELKMNNTNNLKKFEEEFDIQEKTLKNDFENVQKNANISIQNAIKTTKEMVKNLKNRIKSYTTKNQKKLYKYQQKLDSYKNFHLDDKSILHEESEDLQSKVANAISKLVKHYSKKKDKLIQSHELMISNTQHEIENHKEIINNFKIESNANWTAQKEKNENEIKSYETQIEKQIAQLKFEINKQYKAFEVKIDNLRSHIQNIKNDISHPKSRDIDITQIERLTNQLNIKDNQLKELTSDFADYKKRLVQQETIYNSHFGVTPAIAVLRPNTPAPPISVNQRKKTRPLTTAVTMRTSTVLKNKKS